MRRGREDGVERESRKGRRERRKEREEERKERGERRKGSSLESVLHQ